MENAIPVIHQLPMFIGAIIIISIVGSIIATIKLEDPTPAIIISINALLLILVLHLYFYPNHATKTEININQKAIELYHQKMKKTVLPPTQKNKNLVPK